jgi:UDP-glucose 4-epimerase
MRVVVIGATGNVGTSLLDRLAVNPAVDEVIGVARRMPARRWPRVRWHRADVSTDDLVPLLTGADAVVHLAWIIQPSRDRDLLQRINVEGTMRVAATAAAVGVPRLVHASSVGTYAPGPKDEPVDESWPATGVATSTYSSQKAEVEARLDRLERDSAMRIVRLRTALVFKAAAASEIARFFLGRFVPIRLIGRSGIPVLPSPPRLALQVVHSEDAAAAYEAAALGDVSGPFNIAADGLLDALTLARVLGARRLPVPTRLVRAATTTSYRLHLQPTDAGWVDLLLGVPTMSTAAARNRLGWSATRSGTAVLRSLLAGMADAAGDRTPPLRPRAGGRLLDTDPVPPVDRPVLDAAGR